MGLEDKKVQEFYESFSKFTPEEKLSVLKDLTNPNLVVEEKPVEEAPAPAPAPAPVVDTSNIDEYRKKIEELTKQVEELTKQKQQFGQSQSGVNPQPQVAETYDDVVKKYYTNK